MGSKSEKKFEGLCAGGPNDGNRLASDMKRVNVPVLIEGQPGIGVGTYTFHETTGLWIWGYE